MTTDDPDEHGAARSSSTPAAQARPPVEGGVRMRRLLVALFAASAAAMAITAGVPAWWGGFVAAAFVAGALLLVLYRQGGVPVRVVLIGAVVFRLFFVYLPPVLSEDGPRYVWDGVLQHAGVNPYRYAPEDPALADLRGENLHDEPVYAALNSASYYSVYPPVSQLVFAFGGLFYGWGWQASFFAIKAVFLAMELAGVFWLSRLVAPRALLVYAWHPLVLVEAAGQGHTEAALVFFLVAAVALARRGRGHWAAACLAGAAWVKLYPLVLFPLLGRRFGWRAVGAGALVLGALALPYAAPYVLAHVRASLDLYVRLFEFNAGLYLGVKALLLEATGEDWSKTLGPLFRLFFLATLPLVYWLDARRGWSFAQASLVILGLFFVLATTVHPWYLLAVLPLAALTPRPAWHWQWIGLLSLGTYLFYTGGPYAGFVIAGWGGGVALLVWSRADALLQAVQRRRARAKAERLLPHLPSKESGSEPLRLLDLGAGEGYVGQALEERVGARVTLADVMDMNRTPLPLIRYDGRRLPFATGAFDVAVLYFVLHHAEDADAVLGDALRVAARRVIVVESVYESERQRRVLRVLDRCANRVRSGGVMVAQEEHLRFRRAEAWRRMAEEAGARVVAEERWGGWWHRQALLSLAPPADETTKQ